MSLVEQWVIVDKNKDHVINLQDTRLGAWYNFCNSARSKAIKKQVALGYRAIKISSCCPHCKKEISND